MDSHKTSRIHPEIESQRFRGSSSGIAAESAFIWILFFAFHFIVIIVYELSSELYFVRQKAAVYYSYAAVVAFGTIPLFSFMGSNVGLALYLLFTSQQMLAVGVLLFSLTTAGGVFMLVLPLQHIGDHLFDRFVLYPIMLQWFLSASVLLFAVCCSRIPRK